MALVKNLRNTIDALIDEYKLKNIPKYVLCDLDTYLSFKDELVALNLIERPDITKPIKIHYRDTYVLCVFDALKPIEVVG